MPVLQIRLSDQEHQALVSYAKTLNKPLSSLARTILLEVSGAVLDDSITPVKIDTCTTKTPTNTNLPSLPIPPNSSQERPTITIDSIPAFCYVRPPNTK